MNSTLGFTFEKLEKLGFLKIISKCFDGFFKAFFWKALKNIERNRAID